MTHSIENLIAVCLARAKRSDELGTGFHGSLSAQLQAAAAEAGAPALLGMGQRQELARRWEAKLRQEPASLRVWHNLAVLHYWEAKDQEQRGADAFRHWELAIGYWVGVLASDDYWRAWAEERAVPCGVPPTAVSLVRREFLTRIKLSGIPEADVARKYLDAVSSVRRGVRSGFHEHLLTRKSASESWQDLRIQFSHEWAVASRINTQYMAEKVAQSVRRESADRFFELDQWLSEVDWMSEPDTQVVLNTAYVDMGLSFSSPPQRRLPACGPGMLRRLDGGNDASPLEFSPTPDTELKGIRRLLETVALELPLLKLYLDPVLGRLLVLIDLGMYDRFLKEAIDMLQRGNRTKDLKRLLCLACHAQAELSLSHHDYETATSAVELAYRWAPEVYKDPGPFPFDMSRLLGRLCHSVAGSLDRKELPLKTAQDLVWVRIMGAQPFDVPLCNQARQSIPRPDFGESR